MLGWHRADEEQPGQRLRFRPPEQVRLAPAQRATAWYFLVLQLYDAVQNGYWHARQPEFFQQPWPRIIEWMRMPGDLVFLLLGILPVVYLAIRMFAARRRYAKLPADTATEEFTQSYEET